jgi:hypothetical protein
MERPAAVSDFAWARWRRWLDQLDPETRLGYEARWERLHEGERVAAVLHGDRKLRALEEARSS